MEAQAQSETFCQRVVAAARERPDKVAMTLIEPDGQETITFGAMLAQVRSIAYRLHQENVGFGDRVALIGENHPSWAVAYLGILYRGAVASAYCAGRIGWNLSDLAPQVVKYSARKGKNNLRRSDRCCHDSLKRDR